MKVVNKLKKKHRNDYWLDVDGFLWFWNLDAKEWWFLTVEMFPHDGFRPAASVDTGDEWPDKPFTRVR